MTKSEIINMAYEAGCPNIIVPAEWFRFAKLVAAAEREECAKLLDEMAAADKLSNYYQVAALAIRERGAP